MTKHCHQCGKEWKLDGQPGRSESCHSCNEDLRVCLNCIFYDSRVAHHCKERRAEPITEKNRSNFCEYFDFITRDRTAEENNLSSSKAAKEAFQNLFNN